MKPVLALLLTASLSHAADFPMFKGGPARLGRVEQKLGAPVKFAWKVKPGGAFYSSPAIVDHTVFIGNSDHHVYAYSLDKGELKWKTELGERIYGSSPQVEQGQVYIACVNGCVYALNAESGKISGKTCVKKVLAIGSGPDILGSPLVAEGRLYFGSDNHEAYCYDLKSGQKIWSFQADERIHDSSPTLYENLLFVAATDGRVYALDKNSGALVWKSDEFEKLNTTVMAHDGRIYFGAADGKLRCMDAKRGELLWGFETFKVKVELNPFAAFSRQKGVMSSPALSADGTRLVFGGADGRVYCLGLDGSLKWSFEAKAAVLASPLVTGDTVWIGSYDDIFYALNMADGKEVYRYLAGGDIFCSAASSGSKVVVGGRDGALYGFDATLK